MLVNRPRAGSEAKNQCECNLTFLMSPSARLIMAFLKLSVILTVAESGSNTGWLVGAGVYGCRRKARLLDFAGFQADSLLAENAVTGVWHLGST